MLRVGAQKGGQQRDAQGDAQQEQQPGARRAVGGIQQRQQNPEREDDLDDGSGVERLADNKRKDRLRGHHKGREQEQPQARPDAAQERFLQPDRTHREVCSVSHGSPARWLRMKGRTALVDGVRAVRPFVFTAHRAVRFGTGNHPLAARPSA